MQTCNGVITLISGEMDYIAIGSDEVFVVAFGNFGFRCLGLLDDAREVFN